MDEEYNAQRLAKSIVQTYARLQEIKDSSRLVSVTPQDVQWGDAEMADTRCA